MPNKVENHSTSSQPQSLSQHVTAALQTYFQQMEDEVPTHVYQMVLSQVEKPMICFILQQTHYNQSRAAKMLGINRNTLRKKMIEYQIPNKPEINLK